LPRDGKWAENSSLARRTRVIQNPIADFGYNLELAKKQYIEYLYNVRHRERISAPNHLHRLFAAVANVSRT